MRKPNEKIKADSRNKQAKTRKKAPIKKQNNKAVREPKTTPVVAVNATQNNAKNANGGSYHHISIVKKYVDYQLRHDENAPQSIEIKYLTDDGIYRKKIVSRRLLSKPSELLALLNEDGLDYTNQKAVKNELTHIESEKTAKIISYFTYIQGWHEIGGQNCYIFPNEKLEQPVKFLPNSTVKIGLNKQIGDIETWKEIIKCGNFSTRARLVIALGFAPFLLEIMGVDSFGLFVHGPSSAGKTFLLFLASSVSGNIGEKGINTFASSLTSIEQLVRGSNDDLCAIDEFGARALTPLEAKSFIQKITYTALNGNTKSRAGQYETANSIVTTPARTVLLASSEIPLENRYRGEQVRLSQINIAPEGFSDCWDNADADSYIGDSVEARSAKVTELKNALKKNQGTAKIEFLARLQADAQAKEKLMVYFDTFKGVVNPLLTTPSQARISDFFATIYAAAALAIEYNLLPWSAENTLQDIKTCLKEVLNDPFNTGDKSQVLALTDEEVMAHFNEKYADINPIVIVRAKKYSKQKLVVANAFLIAHENGAIKKKLLVKPQAWRSAFPDIKIRSQVMNFLVKHHVLLLGRDNANTSQVMVKEIDAKKQSYYALDAIKLKRLLKKF